MTTMLFLLILGYALFPYFFVIEPLFFIGSAKVYPCDLVFILAFLGGGYKALFVNTQRPMHPLRFCFIAIVVYGLVTSLRGVSSYGYSSFGDHARWSYYIVFLGLSVSTISATKEAWKTACNWLIYIGLACALSSLYKFALYLLGIDTDYDDWVRFSNAVSSLFMVFSLVGILGRYMVSGKWSFWNLVQFAAVLAGLVVGQARTAWVCGIVGIMVLFILNWKKFRSVLRPLIGFSVAGFIFIGILSSTPNSMIADNLTRSAAFVSGLQNDPDWVWRLVIWEQVLDQSLSTPIIGKAFGTPFEFQAPDAFYENLAPHNGWLALMFHQGMVGVLLNAAGFVFTFMTLGRLKSRAAADEGRVEYSVLFAQEIAQVVYFIPYSSTLALWVVPGLALSAAIRDRAVGKGRAAQLSQLENKG